MFCELVPETNWPRLKDFKNNSNGGLLNGRCGWSRFKIIRPSHCGNGVSRARCGSAKILAVGNDSKTYANGLHASDHSVPGFITAGAIHAVRCRHSYRGSGGCHVGANVHAWQYSCKKQCNCSDHEHKAAHFFQGHSSKVVWSWSGFKGMRNPRASNSSEQL